MQTELTANVPWQQLSDLIARRIGLHFPPERYADLQRGLVGAATEFGFEDASACAGWLLSTGLTRPQLQTLAGHLTIGETYFFRERKAFDALTATILPELVRRRGQDRHLRLWSAACCTGEEAYSLSILLQECLPDLKDWRITILATDINERFLQKAAAGIYGEWSFRDSPDAFKSRYFTRTPEGRFALLPQIKERVTFMPLNLAEDILPSLATEAHAMDIIFCRNVLMYFTPEQARKVVDNLHRVLLDGGWLIVSPSEGSHSLFSGFTQVNLSGALLYQKRSAAAVEPVKSWATQSIDPAPTMTRGAPASVEPFASWLKQQPLKQPATAAEIPASATAPTQAAPESVQSTARTIAASAYKDGRYAEAAELLLRALESNATGEPQTFAMLARAFANQGKLKEARSWCERWIASDPLDPTGRYLHAVILQELGDAQQAHRSLQQALYLNPDFVLAHVGLGNLARSTGKPLQSGRHFANALSLLDKCEPEDLLPESEGLTAGRLREILTSLLALEAAS
ncbi:MAG TPA: CheR family methyltransferase [Steroidobacteraceae bacterium]|jgi:chemotaxis protein methyltransferase CheR